MREAISECDPKSLTREAVLGRRIPIIMLVGLFVICDIAIATVVDARSDQAGGILLGVLAAQLTLLAVWTVFGALNSLIRVAIGLALATLIAFALMACIDNTGSASSEVMWFLIIGLSWGIQLVCLWVGRTLMSWRITENDQTGAISGRSEQQFGIGHLLTWTALVAVILGIGRWLLSGSELGGDEPLVIVAFVGILTSSSCLVAMPVIWASLSPGWWPLKLIVAACCCAAFTFAEIAAFEVAIGAEMSFDEFLWFMNTIQASLCCFALLVVRACGFRLVRTSAIPVSQLGDKW